MNTDSDKSITLTSAITRATFRPRCSACLIVALSVLATISCDRDESISHRTDKDRLAALAVLGGLGADVPYDKRWIDDRDLWITCGDKWRGGNEGLAHLEDVQDAYEVILDCPEIDDTGLQHVGQMRRLEGLTCRRTIITDAGLESVSVVRGLQALQLYGSQITDTGFAAVSDHSLMWLLVDNATHITDAGLAHLANMDRMISLRLSGAQVTGSGFAQLDKLQELRSLELSGTHVDDKDLAQLTRFPRLRRLDLSDTKVAGPGLVHLQALSRLLELNLDGTQVDDEALQSLSGIKSLMFISVVKTRVTEAGADQLRTRPGLTVMLQPQDTSSDATTESAQETTPQ
jgi:hypothetical protein